MARTEEPSPTTATRDDDLRIRLDGLPVAAIATREGRFVEVNELFVQLSGWRTEDIVGHTMLELLGKLVVPRDRALLERVTKWRSDPDAEHHGMLWCRMITADRREHPVRVEWRNEGPISIACVIDAKPEVFGQEVTETLARVAGVLSRCASEGDVLGQAVDALCERGFTAAALLLIDDDPLLAYGPSRTPLSSPAVTRMDLPRPPREILTQLNPAFMDRRAAFFQDGMRIVRDTYPEPVAERLLSMIPTRRMVQAPLFVGDKPYGALVVSGDLLTPLVATALDLFAELVGKALEAVQLRRERVERERLAALGEAAGVMAHEVRNPVAAIMNALALLDRDGRESSRDKALLTIIGEETARLDHLVTQLLELGRPLLPRPRECEIEELTERATHLLRTRGAIRDRGPTLEIPTTKATVAWLDPDLAELSLFNVLHNASQSTREDGRIRVRVDASDDWVDWIVEDDGPGIADDVMPRIGQPFVTTRATGTGMGLAVVRRIMQASRGELIVARSGELGGARVTLRFPRPPGHLSR